MTQTEDPIENVDWNRVQEVKELWRDLGDVPIDEDENIDEPFLHFPVGTFREDIWKWFEEELNVSVAYLMGNDVHPITGNPTDVGRNQ